MLKRKKIAYYYDTEDCTYKKAGFDWRVFGKRFASYGFVSVLFCTGFFFLFTREFEKVKEDKLKSEYQYFMDRLNAQNQILTQFDAYLNELYQKDNDLYTSILDAEKISVSAWEGGKSGAASGTDIIHSTDARIEEILRRIKLLRKNYEELQSLAGKLSKDLDNMPAILPVSGNLISGFGTRRHPITGRFHTHTGLDFACSMGTPVYATGDGTVILARDENNGYGLNVDINHHNGYETKYAHLSMTKVKPGQKVKRGDLIAYSGNSGLSTGPHLHYEIIARNTKIDPLDFFYADISPGKFLALKLQAQSDNSPMDYEEK